MGTKFPLRWISSRNLLFNIMPVVSNTVFYTLKLVKRVDHMSNVLTTKKIFLKLHGFEPKRYMTHLTQAWWEVHTVRGVWGRKQKHLWPLKTYRRIPRSSFSFIHPFWSYETPLLVKRQRKGGTGRVSWVSMSQGKMDSSLSVQILDLFFIWARNPIF